MAIRHFLTTAMLMATAATATAALVPEVISRQVLYNTGDMGSRFWRIPALAVTNDGTVIAVADKRNDSNGDLPNRIDLAVRRSSDGGLTWSQPQLIVTADSVGGYGDAALGVHRPTGDLVIVAAHGNGIFQSTPDNHTGLVVIRSVDDGLTWQTPVDITAQLYDPVEGVAPICGPSGFASSGAMLCDDEGRLMFVLVARTNYEPWGALECYACVSDDGGVIWRPSAMVDEYGDESKIVQLADKSYLMNLRNRRRGGRKISRTCDATGHWTLPQADYRLVDPACNGDMIAISPEQAITLGFTEMFAGAADNGLVLLSFADDPERRRNVSVYASDDLGANWQKLYTVTPGGSAYSAMTMMPDGTLGILSEEDNADGGFALWFTKVRFKNE